MITSLLSSFIAMTPVIGWDRYTATAAFLIATMLVLLWIATRQKPVLSFLFVAALLFVAGLLLSSFGLPYLNERFSTALGDAMMIAAILGLTVDYFLKERVLREVSADVSKYLVGYRLPSEVQDRIRWLLQTQWIRRNCRIRCRLTEVDPNRVLLEMTISDDLQNITSGTQTYQDFFEYETHEPQRVLEMRCDSTDAKARYRLAGEDLNIREKPGDPGVMQALGKKVKIPPVHEAIDRNYTFSVHYSAEYPAHYSDGVNFTRPTIGVILEVECPEAYRFTASDAEVSAHNRWEYRRLFLPGETVTYRWQKR